MKIDHYPSCSDAIEREQRRAHATAAEIRDLHDELRWQYFDKELKESMPKRTSSKEPTVSKVELDAYYNAGMKEINKTKSERFFTAIFVLLLLMGGSYLVHFIG